LMWRFRPGTRTVVVRGSVTVTISSTQRISRTAWPDVIYCVLKKLSVLLVVGTGAGVTAGGAIGVDVVVIPAVDGIEIAKMPPGMYESVDARDLPAE
jgi:hypothetical protein